VHVDNSRKAFIPPLSGDFTIFGGLYRPVHLIALDALSISPLDDAGPGVYWKQEHVSRESAELNVTAILRNAESSVIAPRLRFVLSDRNGRTVHTSEQTISATVKPRRLCP